MVFLIALGIFVVSGHNPQSLGLVISMAGGRSLFEATNHYLESHEFQPRSLLDPVSLVENQPTLDEVAPIPIKTTNLISPRENEDVPYMMEKPTENPDDFRDEYLNCAIYRQFNFDHDRFTHDYFVYEQGQKEIIVKNRLRDHLDFWNRIGASKFILDTILYGYKIPFYSLPKSTFLKNNMSAIKDCLFVKDAIKDLLDRNLIEKCSHVRTVVNPLSVSIQSHDKKRLILDLRTVNMHVWKKSIKYEDLRLALLYLEQDSWMIKFDIHSAYHFIVIFYDHTEY